MKEIFIGCILGILAVIGLAALEGWIVSALWNWLVPMFWTNAPILGIWEAFGIMFLLNLIGRSLFGNKNK